MNLTINMMLPVLIGIIVGIIAVILLIVLLLKRKPKGKIKVDESFINELINNYGGKNNIIKVSVDNARLKIEVNDLDLVDLNAIKQTSESGVFVTGNIIKTLFKFDSKLIKSSLDKIL